MTNRLTRKEKNGTYYIVEEKICMGTEQINPIKTWIVENENRGYGNPIDKLGKLEDLEEEIGCPLEEYFKPDNCLAYENAYPKVLYGKRKQRGGLKESLDTSILITEEEFKELLKDYDNNGYDFYCYDERCKQILFCGDYRLDYQWLYIQLLYSEEQLKPKKYLTYEDVMKLETQKVENGIRSSIIYKVRLNEHIYRMYINQYEFSREISIWNFSHNEMFHLFVNEKSKDIINDLKLELVEEE